MTLQHIRPHQALELFTATDYAQRIVPLVLPDRFTPRILETCLLVALLRHVGAERIFEFGTFRGLTTLNLAANLPPGGEIFTLDLDREGMTGIQQNSHDAPISDEHFAWENRLAFLGTAHEDRVKRLYGNSRTFDFSPYAGSMNMVWIDGGHDLDTVRKDTENALLMMDENRPGVVVWHDYGNPHYPDLTAYLDRFGADEDLQHVQETMLVFRLTYPR